MNEVKQAQFEIKDMCELHYFLSVSVHEKNSIWICQPAYTTRIIEKYGRKDAKQ